MPEFTCLFCGKTFTEREVLFANEITSAMSTAPDGTLREYYSRFTSAPTMIPTQLLYHWTDLPPENVTFSEGESIPSTIYIHCRSGKLPKVDSQKSTSDNGTDALFQSLANRGNVKPAEPTGAQKDSDQLLQVLFRSIDENLHMWIDKRICPRCHCSVPRDIEHLKVYRIAMFGGSSSGKTSYMLLAARQMTSIAKMNTLGTALNLAEGELLPECQEYFQQQYPRYINGSLGATVMDDASNKPVFPLIMRISPKNGRASFFLIMQDFPGEGMLKSRFMINYQGVMQADGAVLLVDPSQLVTLGMNGDEPAYREGMSFSDSIDFSQNASSQPPETHCKDELSLTFSTLRNNMHLFNKLVNIVVVLNKVDCLYQAVPPDDPRIKRKRYPLLDKGNLAEFHLNAVDTTTLNDLNAIVNEVFTSLRGVTQKSNEPQKYTTTRRERQTFVNRIFASRRGASQQLDGPQNEDENQSFFKTALGYKKGTNENSFPRVTFKAVSAYTWSEAKGKFERLISEEPGIGHRLLEPILELLAEADLLPTKESDDD